MCGICGIINFSEQRVNKSDINTMLTSMKFRGPDDDGVFLDQNVGLGHVRLSIIDLSSAGKQPFSCDENRFYIVFNGEIYNYIELKKELLPFFKFKTNTDTEVLLNGYKHWGKKVLSRLNGMFAFAIYDTKKKEIFAARDRFGIKPFYYYKDKNRFVFSSDILSILNSNNEINTSANTQIVFDFLALNRTDHSSETFFKNIKKLKPSHALVLSVANGEIDIYRWYNLRTIHNFGFLNAEEYLDSFSSSINLRLRSDVSVGISLSGGLDSSSILSTWKKLYPNDELTTYSAIYNKGEKGDESKFIELYRDKVNKMFFVKPTVNSLINDLNKFVFDMKEPIPSTSEYAQHKLMELVQGKSTVILSGQGADECLAGHHYFFGVYFKELFKSKRFLKLSQEIFYYFINHQSSLGLKSWLFFSLPVNLKSIPSNNSVSILVDSFSQKNKADKNVLENLYNSSTLYDSFCDHFEYKFEHLLNWADRSSMTYSIESRFPFLDHNLVEKTITMISDAFIEKGTTKTILRKAMRGILPESIRIRQDKIGYETPEDKWFRTEEMKNVVLNIFNSKSFKNRGIINHKKAIKQYELHCRKKQNIGREIWKWIHLELWYQQFID